MNILTALLLAVSVSAVAGPVVASTVDTVSTSLYNPSEQSCNSDCYALNGNYGQRLETMLLATNGVGQCMADCASEQGICISQCQGDGQCIGNCAAAHGRCVARCN